MSYFSQAVIEAKLDAISSAIDVVLSGGEEYSLNDGQGMMRVKRSTLDNLEKAAEYWQGKLDDLTDSGNIVSMEVGR